MAAIDGNCLCGAVTIRVAGAHDPRVGACHCRMCQRWSGGAFLFFTAEAASVTVTGKVALYQSSSFAERAFCPACGSHLWFRDIDKPDLHYDLMPGLFDQAHNWPIRSEVYSDLAPAYVRLEGTHLRRTQAEYEATNAFVKDETP